MRGMQKIHASRAADLRSIELAKARNGRQLAVVTMALTNSRRFTGINLQNTRQDRARTEPSSQGRSSPSVSSGPIRQREDKATYLPHRSRVNRYRDTPSHLHTSAVLGAIMIAPRVRSVSAPGSPASASTSSSRAPSGYDAGGLQVGDGWHQIGRTGLGTGRDGSAALCSLPVVEPRPPIAAELHAAGLGGCQRGLRPG